MKTKHALFLLAILVSMGVASTSLAAVNAPGQERRGGAEDRNRQAFGQNDERPTTGNPFTRGSVTAINDTTITISSVVRGSDKEGAETETKTYTIDASKAKFYKDGTETTISEITVGDNIVVEGTLDGSTITATKVHEGNLGNGNRANGLDKDDLQNRAKENRSVWSRIGDFFSKIFKGKNK